MRENVVYDFAMFEPKQEREEAQEPEKEQRRLAAVKPRAQSAFALHPAAAARIIALALAVAVALAAIMLGNVQLTKLNDEITKTQSQLTAAQGENVRLNMQLESRSTLSNVEAFAESVLGLRKTSQSQVTYIHLADTDKVEVTPKSENIFTSVLNLIMEYL